MLEGSYEIFLDGKTERRGPGDFVNILSGVAHGFRNAGACTARMLIINVPGGIHEHFFADAGDPVGQFDKLPADQPTRRAQADRGRCPLSHEMLKPA